MDSMTMKIVDGMTGNLLDQMHNFKISIRCNYALEFSRFDERKTKKKRFHLYLSFDWNCEASLLLAHIWTFCLFIRFLFLSFNACISFVQVYYGLFKCLYSAHTQARNVMSIFTSLRLMIALAHYSVKTSMKQSNHSKNENISIHASLDTDLNFADAANEQLGLC